MSDNKTHVLVTGASGYIASWIVQYLLDEGIYIVHACVRDVNSDSCKHLKSLNDPKDNLRLFGDCDLLIDGSYEKAMEGCEYVIHTASPFLTTTAHKNPQKELIEPALLGTENVLKSCNKISTVTRVVLTSSVVAIYGDKTRKTTPYTEDDWNNEDDINSSPYNYSKSLAEKRAWEMQKEQSRWSLVTINPAFVMGPSLSTRLNDGSMAFMHKLLTGKFFVGANIKLGLVDVRDVAKAHILAMHKGEGRFICCHTCYTIKELGNLIKPETRKKFKGLPTIVLPDFLIKTFGSFVTEYSREFLNTSVGTPLEFSNTKIKNELGLEFHADEDTITDMAEFMKREKLV